MINQETVPSPTLRRRGIRGFFKNLLYWILDWDDEITLAQGRERMRSRPSFLASLPPETLEYLRNYDGPENMGPPLTRRERRLLAERLSNK
jgi:hypothetical protein